MVANTGCNWATQTPFGCKVTRTFTGNNPPVTAGNNARTAGTDWHSYQAGQTRFNRVESFNYALAKTLCSYQLRAGIAGHIMILNQTINTRSGQLWPVYVNPWSG